MLAVSSVRTERKYERLVAAGDTADAVVGKINQALSKAGVSGITASTVANGAANSSLKITANDATSDRGHLVCDQIGRAHV